MPFFVIDENTKIGRVEGSILPLLFLSFFLFDVGCGNDRIDEKGW